jgi:hypothetical protein
LRQQIAVLERMLAEIEAKHPGVAPASAPTRRGIGPTLLDAAELEQVRATLVRRLATVQAAIDQLRGEEVAAGEAPVAQKRKPQQPQVKPASRRAPRARGPMRPAPEGA